MAARVGQDRFVLRLVLSAVTAGGTWLCVRGAVEGLTIAAADADDGRGETYLGSALLLLVATISITLLRRTAEGLYVGVPASAGLLANVAASETALPFFLGLFPVLPGGLAAVGFLMPLPRPRGLHRRSSSQAARTPPS